MHRRSRLQRLEMLAEIAFLWFAQAELAEPVVVLDHRQEIGERAAPRQGLPPSRWRARQDSNLRQPARSALFPRGGSSERNRQDSQRIRRHTYIEDAVFSPRGAESKRVLDSLKRLPESLC